MLSKEACRQEQVHICLTFFHTFRCGDEIMEINDTVVYNMALNDVYTVLSQCTPGPVHIIVSRHPDPKVQLACTLFVNSRFFFCFQGKASSETPFGLHLSILLSLPLHMYLFIISAKCFPQDVDVDHWN